MSDYERADQIIALVQTFGQQMVDYSHEGGGVGGFEALGTLGSIREAIVEALREWKTVAHAHGYDAQTLAARVIVLEAALRRLIDAQFIPRNAVGDCAQHGEEWDLCDACEHDRQTRAAAAVNAAHEALCPTKTPTTDDIAWAQRSLGAGSPETRGEADTVGTDT